MRLYLPLFSCLLFSGFARSDEPKEKPTLVLNANGHTAKVCMVLFTPDGKQLVTVSDDKSIRTWDVAYGTPLRVLRPPIGPGPEGKLYAAAISPDGNTLAVGGYGMAASNYGAIYLISFATGQIDRVLEGHTNIICTLAFSPDGKWLASGSSDKTARLWDLGEGKCRYTLDAHTARVQGITFAPDSLHLATASYDKTARIWSVASGESETVLQGHEKEVQCIVWSPDGKTIATGSDDESIRLWNADGVSRKKYTKLENHIGSIAFTPDSQKLLFTRKGFLKTPICTLLDFASGKEKVHFTRHKNTVFHGAISPKGDLAATTGGGDDETFIWNTTDAKVIHHLVGRGKAVSSAGWNVDADTIAWGNSTKTPGVNALAPLHHTFHLADLKFGASPDRRFRRAQPIVGSLKLELIDKAAVAVKRQSKTISILRLSTAYDSVHCFTLLSGDRAVVGSEFGLYSYDINTGKQIGEFQGHTGPVYAVSPSPDSRHLLSASGDQTLRIWDTEKAQSLLALFFADDDWVAWTPEGYYAASVSGESLVGWQASNGLNKMATASLASQFHKELYQPEVIKRVLKTGSTKRAIDSADRALGTTSTPKDVADILPPKVTITSPSRTDLHRNSSALVVKATARSVGGHPIKSMKLLLDGVNAGVQQLAEPRLGEIEQSWNVQLTPGSHTLVVQAESTVSNGASEPIEVRYLSETNADIPLPNLYVFAVGIAEYPGDLKLKYAGHDAEAVARVLNALGKPLYRTIEMQVLTDQKATRLGILNGFAWLKSKATQNDIAVFFYSGHRFTESNECYLVPVDGNRANVLAMGISDSHLNKALADIPGRKIMMLDACYAGAVGGQKGDPSLSEELIRDLVNNDSGVICMCSSMKREPSRESSEHGQGYFTEAVLEGLSGKSDLVKGAVYLHKLDAYVTDRVKDLTKGEQHAVTSKPASIRSFPLTKP